MKLLHPTLEKIARALEFTNIDSVREMEELLEKHAEGQESPATAHRPQLPAAVRPVTSAKILKLSGSHC